MSERYKAMVDAFDGYIYICSQDYKIEYMNQKFADRCGGDKTGQLCYKAIHNLETVCPWCVNDRVWKNETVRWELQSPLDKKWYFVVNVPIRHSDGTKSKFAMIIDITERKTQTIALLEGEKRFRELADNLPLTVFEADLKGQFTFVNKTGLSWFGYSAQDVAGGVNIVQTVIEEDRPKALDSVRQLLSGCKPVPNEYTGIRKDGTTLPVLIVTRPILDDTNVPVGIRGIVMDITERIRTEQALQNTEKLESLGVLAGGIAHDFNNLLSGIFGFLYLARLKVGEGEAKQSIDQAISVFSRAKSLTQQLLTFAKGGYPVKKSVPLAGILLDTVKFALSGSKIKAEFDIEDGLWPCDIDEYQISQVIDNIVINARDAMPLGGTIGISAGNVSDATSVPAPLVKSKYVKIGIVDCGIGIPPEILGRVFDPFFTTKQHGSGLGLAAAYSIVKRHNGHIFADSVQAKGSTFTIYLPATEFKPEPIALERKAGIIKKHGTVLFMDDEEFIRKLCEEAITEFGFKVLLASDGNTAIDLFNKANENNEPIDILILDLTIPGGKGGVETIAQIRKIAPNIPAVATSGYSDDPVMAEPQKYGFQDKLVKPFLVDEIYNILANLVSK